MYIVASNCKLKAERFCWKSPEVLVLSGYSSTIPNRILRQNWGNWLTLIIRRLLLSHVQPLSMPTTGGNSPQVKNHWLAAKRTERLETARGNAPIDSDVHVQATIHIPYSNGFVLLLERNCIFEVLPDCALCHKSCYLGSHRLSRITQSSLAYRFEQLAQKTKHTGLICVELIGKESWLSKLPLCHSWID